MNTFDLKSIIDPERLTIPNEFARIVNRLIDATKSHLQTA
jgi:hypothetical protein